MVAGYFRHQFKQGEKYSIDVDLRDSNGLINTTGWTGASAIKTLDGVAPVDENNQPIAFAVTFPSAGTVRSELTPMQTYALSPKRYLYDARLVDASGTPAYYLDGDVIVQRSYTLLSDATIVPLIAGTLTALLPVQTGTITTDTTLILSGSLFTQLTSNSGSLTAIVPVVSVSGVAVNLLPALSGSLTSVALGGMSGTLSTLLTNNSGTLTATAPIASMSGTLSTLLTNSSGSLSASPIVSTSGTLATLLSSNAGSLTATPPIVVMSGSVVTLPPIVSGSLTAPLSGVSYNFSQPQNIYLAGV